MFLCVLKWCDVFAPLLWSCPNSHAVMDTYGAVPDVDKDDPDCGLLYFNPLDDPERDRWRGPFVWEEGGTLRGEDRDRIGAMHGIRPGIRNARPARAKFLPEGAREITFVPMEGYVGFEFTQEKFRATVEATVETLRGHAAHGTGWANHFLQAERREEAQQQAAERRRAKARAKPPARPPGILRPTPPKEPPPARLLGGPRPPSGPPPQHLLGASPSSSSTSTWRPHLGVETLLV